MLKTLHAVTQVRFDERLLNEYAMTFVVVDDEDRNGRDGGIHGWMVGTTSHPRHQARNAMKELGAAGFLHGGGVPPMYGNIVLGPLSVFNGSRSIGHGRVTHTGLVVVTKSAVR